jgi:hypothetical protein
MLNYKKLIPITFILSLILLIASAIIPITTNMPDIPIVSWALGDEATDTFKDIDESIDELEEFRDNDEFTSKQKRAFDNVLEKAEKLDDSFSLLNIRNFISSAKAFGEELEEATDIDSDLETIDEIESYINIIILVVLGLFVLPLIFTLLGGLLKSKGLTITALVLVILPQLALSGILFVILSLIIYITQAVFCGKAKKQAAVPQEAPIQ